MKPDGVTDPPGTNAVMEAYGWQTHRTLDEVRAAALHEAIRIAGCHPTDMTTTQQILDLAERFEAWLAKEPAE